MLEEPSPGLVVLFGSGETSPSGRRVFETVLKSLPPQPRIALLETPAGFELNSYQVISRVGDFIRHRLQNYQPQITIVSARDRNSILSPDNPKIVKPLLEADLIFLGPGSPTYAIRQLKDSLAWQYLVARYLLGGGLIFASAATVAMSSHSLPVYEIYKVGEDLHWNEGLDFFGMFGLPFVFIPHWNNDDGGVELDTSRCFMGQSRFNKLIEMLPPMSTILGVDEKTALILDVQKGTCIVQGLGGITLLHTGHQHPSSEFIHKVSRIAEVVEENQRHEHYHRSGETFSLSGYYPFEIRPALQNIPLDIWTLALEAQIYLKEQRRIIDHPSPCPTSIEELPHKVQVLLADRQKARDQKDWVKADELRTMIEKLDWKVEDTPEGERIEKRSKA